MKDIEVDDEVKAKLKMMRQAHELVNEVLNRFVVENDLLLLDDEMIERFLAQTADIELDEASRLISLAGRCGESWERLSKVYRYMVTVLQDNHSYNLWITSGLAMMSNKEANLDYRSQIADGVEKLIKESSEVYDDTWAACFWGEFYFKHPRRDDTDLKWLQQAKKWMEISLEQLKSSGECGPHEYARLGDVYRGLGKLPDAARFYREALSYNSKGCCEDSYPDNIKAKLALCGDV
ncbi:MAG: hypothetical protein JST89_00580 [Cyanobacteria bacterium SZAS-4]|nr:hypothetical protein [Cyanobacteria bacterium SZAS-4]